MRKLFAMTMCLLMLCALIVAPAAGAGPYVSRETETFFLECFRVASSAAAPCPTYEEVKVTKGYTVAEQYGNCMRYFDATGDTKAFTVARQLITTGIPFDAEANPEYTFAIDYDRFVEKDSQPHSPFPDVPVDAWYAEAVTAMANSGIVKGAESGMFYPDQPVTEGEFYAMLVRAGSYEGANIGGGNYGEHWASGILQTAEVLSFFPPESGWEDVFATRGEAVTRIVRLHNKALEKGGAYKAGWMWKQKNGLAGGNAVAFESIPDSDDILGYIETALGELTPEQFAYAYSTGIAKGVDETGRFDPEGTLTRAEVAQMFYNAGITARLNIFPRSKTSEAPVGTDPVEYPEAGILDIEVVETGLYDFTSKEYFIQ